ncbi:HNH endonuclease [Winogradskyella sp.]|uniref:HNH endonuclease n=1 Tax=Winogradskyella sp. TaxID=1883156 RepID=UPI0026302967|nr:HNH endonuclease [Winogradskyella sp.]
MKMLSELTSNDYKSILPIALVILFIGLRYWYKKYAWKKQREARRDYYRNVYLKSDAWRRKRYLVMKRDNWTCVYCGKRATQVHHTRYAKYNIGREPIEWLESVCKSCHDSLHY